MLFRYSLRLLMENFKNVYKILLYKAIVGIVMTALCAALILPEIMEIWDNAITQELVKKLRELFAAFFSGDEQLIKTVKDAIFSANGLVYQFGNYVLSRAKALVLATVGCIIIFLVKRFADTLCYFSVGSVINDKMGKFAETRLSMSYIENFKKACKYAVVYVPLAFLFDAISIVLVLLLLQNVNFLSALSLSVTLVVLLQCVKFTCTWHWIPSMVTDNVRVRDLFKGVQGVPKKQTGRLFSTYLVSVYCVIILNVSAALFTFGSALLLTVPISYLLFVCLHFVQYYTLKGKKFFIRLDQIAHNKDFGDSANLLDYTLTTNEEVKDTQE